MREMEGTLRELSSDPREKEGEEAQKNSGYKVRM